MRTNNERGALPAAAVPRAAIDRRARRYPPTRINAAIEVGREAGLPASTLLEGSGLDLSDLADAETLTSIGQYLTVVGNLSRHYPGVDAGIRFGRRLHLSHYGMYGYAMLCAGSYRQACDIAVRYAVLRAPVIDTSVEERPERLTWIFSPRVGASPAELGSTLHRTLMEAQFTAHVVSTQELMGPECVPLQARFSTPAPPCADELVRAWRCPVLFDQPADELDYARHWIDRAPRLASPLMAAWACKALDRELLAFRWTTGIASRVRDELTRTPGHFPTMEALAARLSMTSRHLRRKLDAEGTSYQELLAGVRLAMATDFLTSSQLAPEDIASVLGFSDATSFRNAFKRWTGKTPAQFRGAR